MSTPAPVAGRSRSHTLWIGVGAAMLIIAAGFAGFDRWFYENVSLALNDETRPLARDFHRVTRPVWETLRLACASIWAAAALAALGAILDDRRWRLYLAAFAAIALTALAANVLQGAVGRLRPNQADSHLAFTAPLAELFTKRNVGFPSGEAATAFAIAGAGAALWPRQRAAFIAAACLGAAARLVNGAHYPSDVAAGALLGWYLCRWTQRKLGRWPAT